MVTRRWMAGHQGAPCCCWSPVRAQRSYAAFSSMCAQRKALLVCESIPSKACAAIVRVASLSTRHASPRVN